MIMKKFKDSVFLLVLLSISILITACSSSDDGVSNNPINDSEATANLTIKVVDASDVNQKLDGTYVRIEGESELKTGTQGTVTFNLKANNTYTISVMPTKDGYIATEGINIDLTNKDKEKTIKVAQELVTETISADTTEVGNGLADMELDDTVKTELAGKEVSVAKAEKTVIDLIDESSADSTGGFDPATEKVLGETYSFKITSGTTDITSQSNILAVNKAIISSTDASDIPAITMKLDLSNLVDDMNNINGDKYGLLAVIIATDGTPAFKKIKGTDININRETGKISGKVPIKDANGNLVAEVNLSIIETKDVDEIEENKETTVEDAKEFVSDLKGHGVNLKEVGKGQAQKIETNIKQDVVPYLVAMGYRLEKVEEVLDVWSELFGLAAENIYAEYPEDIGYGPGDYTIDLSKKEAYDDYINLAYNNWSKYEEEALLYYFPDYNDYRTDWEQYQQENYYTYYQYRDYYFGEHNSQYNDYYEDEVYEFVDGYIEKAIRNEAEEATNFIIAKQLDENPREIDKWEWNLTFANSQEKVTIGINNPQDILSIEEVDSQEYEGYEKAIIDFTKADFSYLHTSGTDSTMNWSLDFTVDGAETQTIKQVDIDEYSWEDSNGVNIVRYRYDDTFIIPTKGSIKVTGIMKDSLNFTDEDGVFVDMYEDGIYDTDDELPVDVPAIGEVVLGAVVNIDLTDSKSISYNGSFDSEEFDYQGDAEVKFAKFPSSLQAIADGDESPVVSSFNSSGEFTTKVFKISG
jgi:uncharacterized protein (UPF0335 family)